MFPTLITPADLCFLIVSWFISLIFYSSPPASQQRKPKQKTPGSKKKDNSFTSPVTPKTANSPGPTPGVVSPAIQQQLMDIINNPNSPKEPYFITLNKGLPAEQSFLVDPSQLQKQTINNQATSYLTSKFDALKSVLLCSLVPYKDKEGFRAWL